MRRLALLCASALLTAACGGNSSSPTTTSGSASGNGGATQAGAGGAGAGGAHVGGGGAGGSTAGAVAGGSAGEAAAGMAGTGGIAPGENGLEVSPTELIFGSVQQVSSAHTITLHNRGPGPVTVHGAQIIGADAAVFQLMPELELPLEVAAGASEDAEVVFTPSGIALFKAGLMLSTVPNEFSHSIELYGLGTKGLEGENEPFLKIVLDTLGYDIDVGGSGLLSTTTPLVGTEVAAPRFKVAVAGEPVELIPVARYSPEEPIPYGYYDADGEVEVGTIRSDQYQALNPKTDPGSERTFADPGIEFGIFTSSETHKTYTEDAKNASNQVKHAARSYPLQNRAGTLILNAYLVCFEEAANGDYQDYVFTLKNVIAVAP